MNRGSRTLNPKVTVELNRAIWAAGILILTVGCSGPREATPPVSYRDSAGIEIVENASPAWGPSGGWALDSVPLLEIGADPDEPDQQLYGIGDILLLGDGRLVVVNEGLVNVLMFDSLGTFLGQIGRHGEGPGEFQRVEGAYRCPGDTIAVNDFRRLSLFDAQARFVRTERLVPLPGDDAALRIQGVSDDCSRFLMRSGFRIPQLGTVGHVSYSLFWGTLDNTVRDTILAEVGREAETKVLDGGAQALPVLWGAWGKWVAGDGRAYVGTGTRPELRVFDDTGRLLRIVRWQEAPTPVTAADHATYSTKRQRAAERFPQVVEAFPPLDEYARVAEYKPFLLDLLMDDEGNLWVREYPATVAGRPDLFDYADPDAPLRENPASDEESERWKVFDPSGRWLGAVEVPAELALKAVHRDRAIGVWRDELDVERVRVYRLKAP